MNPILEGLNPAQVKAVLHGEGPLLIIAGAGTGKTTVLTKRIAQLISSKKALPSGILALTFTDRAALEMEERVDRLVPYGFNDVLISTFHSFGDKLLRDHAFEIGFSPNFKVYSQPETVVFMTQHLFDLNLKYYRPLQDPTRFIENLLAHFSRAKDEEIAPKEFIKEALRLVSLSKNEEEKEEAEKCLEVAECYQAYEELKLKKGFIDFGDQVILALKILREKPAVLKKYQARFKYILVDEFQDTNYAQFELVKLLAGTQSNLTVVGDDDQSIYKFRGACLSNILGFRKSYPQAKEIVLDENYRSTESILGAAYQLIQQNNPNRLEYQDKINKSLRSQSGVGKRVEYLHFETRYEEADEIALKIQKKVKEENPEYKDFAILVRTNGAAEPFIKSLNALAIPWRFSGNAGLYDQEEIKIALSFLRALDSLDDSTSLYYLATTPLYSLDAEVCLLAAREASKSHRTLFEIFKKIVHGETWDGLEFSDKEKEKIEKLILDLQKFRNLSSHKTTGRLLYDYFESIGTFRNLAEGKDYRSVEIAQNLRRFFDLIKKFGEAAQYDRVHFFVQYIEALKGAGDDPASSEASWDENAVNILTVHAAKGLEFPIVFLVGLEQGHFPLYDRKDPFTLPEGLIKDILPSGDVHIQEERRLFYVGLTRAKGELTLSCARDMGKKKMWKVSQFVLETADKPTVDIPLIKANPIQSLLVFSYKEPVASLKSMVPSKLSLSVTAVDDYLDCAMKFKFSHLLKIPVSMHHTAVFGMAIHEALKGYHNSRKENIKMSVDELQALFKKCWRSEGFISREHEEIRFQEGLNILKSYYKKEEESESLPTLVEESFRFNVDDVTVRGRWDRVDVSKDNSAVIDYKTADVKTQKDADHKAKDSIQLLLYSVAFQNKYGFLPKKAVLHFVKTDLIGSSVPEVKRVEKALAAVREAIQKIKGEKFDPNPGYQCRYCPYEKICPGVDGKGG